MLFAHLHFVFNALPATEKKLNELAFHTVSSKSYILLFKLAVLFGITGGIWFICLSMFYTIYWSGLFKAYSGLLLFSEMLEQFLFFVDPIVYIAMSSELRRPLLKLIGKGRSGVHPSGATSINDPQQAGTAVTTRKVTQANVNKINLEFND